MRCTRILVSDLVLFLSSFFFFFLLSCLSCFSCFTDLTGYLMNGGQWTLSKNEVPFGSTTSINPHPVPAKKCGNAGVVPHLSLEL
jgi:hypothetical protein